MADLRVTGNLILIGTSGGTVALGSQPSGGGFTYLLPTSIPQVGQNLVVSSVFNGNTANLQWGSASGVTSVTLTTPSFLTVSGAPVIAALPWNSVTAYSAGQVVNYAGVSYIALQNSTNQEPDLSPTYWAITTSGIIRLGLASQSANLVFASPNGSAGVPAFRALAAADVPALSALSGSLNPSQIAQDGATASQALVWGGSAWAPATLVTTFNGRSGAVVSQSGDYSYSQISGTPQLPVTPVVPSHNFLNGYSSTSGLFVYAQPSASDLTNGLTGTGAVVLATSPSIATPTVSAPTISGTAVFSTANPTFFSSTGTGSVVLATTPTLTSATLAGTTVATTLHLTGTLLDGTDSAGTTNQVLTSTGTGTLWATSPGGTVTSVALTTPSFLTVAGSPVTTSGTLAVTLATQAANTVFAGPATGANAAPTFRALVDADLPGGTTGSGAVVLAVGPNLTGTASVVNLHVSGTLADDTNSVGATGQVLTSTGSGTLWATYAVPFNDITSGTNATATMTVGTGASLTFSGTGTVNANELYSVVISNTAPSAGQVLTATSSSAAQWSTPTASGAVNNGTAGQLTWYAATGTAVSGNANATMSSGTLALGQSGSVAGQLALSGPSGTNSAVVIATYATTFSPWVLTLPTSGGTSGYVLETDGAGNTSWVAQGGGGGGSVSAFSAGSLSPLFTTSVSNPTTTPDLTFTAINQSANLVFAGPTTGGGAAPTFRSLVDSDLPGGVTGTGAVVLADAPTFTANPTFASATGTGAIVLAASPTLSGTATVANFSVTGTLTDNSSSTGTSGQVLTAGTGGQVVWGAAAFSGSISTGQIAFGTATDTVGGSNNFTWDNTDHILSVADGYLDRVTGTTSIAFDNATSNHGDNPVTTVTGTPSFPLEWALAITVPTHPYIYDSAFQVVDDTNLLLIAAKPLTDTEPVTFSTGGGGHPFASIISFFRSTPNLAQVVGQTPGSTTWTFPYTTGAGDTIVVALGGVEHNITAVSVTDTQGNTYVQEGYALQAGPAYVFLFVAQSTTPLVAGTDSITGVYTGGGSEDITLLELAPAGATLALASNNVIVTTNSGLGGTHITDQGGGGLSIAATDDNNYLSLSSSDVGGTLIADSGTTGMLLSVSGTTLATYPVTSVDATDGTNTVYHGIFPVFSLAGVSITTSGFTNGVNNITAAAVSSTRYTLKLPNSSAIAEAQPSALATNNLGGTLTLSNSSFGGTYVTDSGGGGITISETGNGNGITISNAGVINGTFIHDTSGTGITVKAETGSSAITLLNMGTGNSTWNTNGGGIGLNDGNGGNISLTTTGGGTSSISTSNNGSGGTSISDTGGGGITVTDTSNAGILIKETGAGGATIEDTGSGGVLLYANSSTESSYGISLDSTPSPNSPSLGIFIRDNGTTGILIEEDNTTTGGITLNNNGAGSAGITIEDTSATGVFISNSAEGGVSVSATAGGGIFLTNSNSGGTTFGSQWVDATGKGILISTTSGGTYGSYAIGIANVAGSGYTYLTDNGGDKIEIDATGGGTLELNPSGGVVHSNSVLVAKTVASGTVNLNTAAIASGTAGTVVTAAATGALTTDNLIADFSADPTSTVGYEPSANGMLTIIKYITSGQVNFKVVNNTGASITPGAVTLQWRVMR